ncbi:hypothetical protein [Variovorax sp. CAN15]|uniref:hypothetical protein n=1 Tax=Variovorax sp. CAN15 TaxID=3046727 RepID=UPI002648B28F|nr:hypothetical protein [Variovorax sp. CAN15]
MIYADQAMDIVYGLHTSKVVLGEETGSGVRDIRPVGVVVIPTATLLGMALGVVRDLSSAGMLKETAERYAGILTFMRDGLSADLSPQTQSESE